MTTEKVETASIVPLCEIARGTDITSIPGTSFEPINDQMITFKYNKSAGYKMLNISGTVLPWIKNASSVAADFTAFNSSSRDTPEETQPLKWSICHKKAGKSI